jgi:hypothetical protein
MFAMFSEVSGLNIFVENLTALYDFFDENDAENRAKV